jgi:hypothetical protein
VALGLNHAREANGKWVQRSVSGFDAGDSD